MSSRLPVSSQQGLHPRLEQTVLRHCRSSWQQPIRQHSRQAFDQVEPLAERAAALVLDAGCGVAESTAQLARLHPDALVIGIDKSAHRLARAHSLPDNARLVRAELGDFWRLARQAGWRLREHALYYPNPWPKAAQLLRRWHGHPVFPDILGLGGRLELRTNFELYALEFAAAVELTLGMRPEVVSFQAADPISPFERKYALSGHPLYRVIVNLD